jgi:hypothetical protein
MADMKYDSGELRNSGSRSRKSSEAADAASRKLSGSSAGNPFGNVSGAESLAGALTNAQTEHAKGARSAADDRDTQAERVDRTADLGDELTTVTTHIANKGAAQKIADQM